MAQTHLCVLLPAYNEAAHIGAVVAAVRAVEIAGVTITPLVVNDGSRDDTASLAAAAGATVVSHERNRGVGAAFRTGLIWALDHGAEYLVHMDSDGQVLPEEIPRLFEPVRSGRADLAVGSRFLGPPPDNLDRWKVVVLRAMAGAIGLLTGEPLSDISCGFRCMNRKVMEAIRPTFDYDYIQETLIQALALRIRVAQVPVTVLYSKTESPRGMSKRVLRYGSRFLVLTGYSLMNFYRARLHSKAP